MKIHEKRYKLVIVLSVFVLILMGIYVVSRTDYEGVSVNMSYEEMTEVVPNGFFYSFHYYYTNKWGNPVVVKMKSGPDGIFVEKICCYSALWTSTSSKAFNRITYGMSPFEVTQLVGIPLGSKTSGYVSTCFENADGKEYEVYWVASKDNPSNVYVRGLLADGEIIFWEKPAE